MNPVNQAEKIEEQVSYHELDLKFSSENLFDELFEMIQILTSEANWNTNINIINREEQKQAFLRAKELGEEWTPEFEFDKTKKDFVALKNNIQQCIKASENISDKNMSAAGIEVMAAEDMQRFFSESFRELKLYAELAEKVEDRDEWLRISKEIWPMISTEEYKNSLEAIQGLENKENEKTLTPENVKKMFEEEIARLDFDYNVEIRPVSGCFNYPSERKVIVASGDTHDRKYSEEEAEMLTKHEIFHVVRGINGRNISSKFPEVLGVHSPFYDQTEEGGALYREIATNTNYEAKDFDYHLRLIAAYKMSNRESYHTIVEDLMDLGGSLDRSFYLVTRNREILRHHIYLSGLKNWKNNDREKLMLGKVNPEWAEKFWDEIEDGEFNSPLISAEKVFN